MSRLYFTAEMKYTDGIKIPVFKIYTGDHTGGSYNIGGIHPSTIAKMAGKGPKIGDQERFDVKFHVNKTRANASLIVNTSKHLPSVSWSTDSGLGKLPLGLGALGTAILGKSSSTKSSSIHPKSRRYLDDSHSRSPGNSRRYIEDSHSRSPGHSRRYIEESHSRSPDHPRRHLKDSYARSPDHSRRYLDDDYSQSSDYSTSRSTARSTSRSTSRSTAPIAVKPRRSNHDRHIR